MSAPLMRLLAKRQQQQAPVLAQQAGLTGVARGEVPGGPMQSWALPPLPQRDLPIESVAGPQDLLMAAPMAARVAGQMGRTAAKLWPMRSPLPRVGEDLPALDPMPMSGPHGPGPAAPAPRYPEISEAIPPAGDQLPAFEEPLMPVADGPGPPWPGRNALLDPGDMLGGPGINSSFPPSPPPPRVANAQLTGLMRRRPR